MMPDPTPLAAIVVLAALAFGLLIAWAIEVAQHALTRHDLEDALRRERHEADEANTYAAEAARLDAMVSDLRAAQRHGVVPFDQEA